MNPFSNFRSPDLALRIGETISHYKHSARIMEFCGTHTTSILRFGIRQLLPPWIELVSGPGCPVCVTANADIDRAIALAELPGIILTTFGDMLKVPGSEKSLAQVRAEGADIRIVYSTIDALEIARSHPNRKVVFLGVGFETTAPTIAASVIQAHSEGLTNYSVFSLAKLCPPIMDTILKAGEVKLDGILCPGHVSAIIGAKPYEFIPQKHNIACAIAGFEPLDILQAIAMLLNQIDKAEPSVEIAYTRGVSYYGNPSALGLVDRVFESRTASWRGIGEVPLSGLKLRDSYSRYDAERLFDIKPIASREHKGCICGEIIRAVKTPNECHLFRSACTPEHPIGPCMVSNEGACSAYFLYGDGSGG